MFWRVYLATIWRLTSAAKNACFAQWGQFLKSFSVFPRTFVTIHFPKHSVSPSSNSIFCFISTQNLQEKGMGFHSHTLYFLFLSFSLLIICVDILICIGLVIWCWALSMYGMLRILVYMNLFRLLDLFFIICLSLNLGFIDWLIPILFDLILVCCFKMFGSCLLGFIVLFLWL